MAIARCLWREKVNVTIREAKPGDEPIIVELIRELARTIGEQSPLTEGYARDYLSHPGSGVFLAEVDSQIIGLVSYSIRPNLYHAAGSGLIEELLVREAFRSHGVGRALMTELLHRLALAGCAEVSVSTTTDNEAARRFYKSLGLVDEAILLEKHFLR